MREWALGLRNEVKALETPSFGALLGSVNGTNAADIVVAHRIVNKIHDIDEAEGAERALRSVNAMFERDLANAEFVPKMSDDLEWGRLRLHHWFRGFRKSYTFRAPNGASAHATNGYNDILSKLEDINQWEVSPENMEYATTIAYKNQALKRLVRAKFRASVDDYVVAACAIRSVVGTNGYACFRFMFKSLCSINAVSRVETVPKNNDDDRVITCEPLWNMICQLSYMYDIRNHMRKRLGYDINTRGDLHKTLLNSKEIATIDLKAASDLVTLQLVEKLWPEHMLKDLRRLRPKLMQYKDGDYVGLHMFAPMGTGITFDVMSFTLLAILRFDRSATVFGDDIIIKRMSVSRAYAALRDAGLVINKEKSFVDGLFRESCGGMFHDDIGYVISYDFRMPQDICDLITAANKLQLIIRAKQVSFMLEGILEKWLHRLHSLLPRDAYADKTLCLTSEYVTGYTGSRVKTRLSVIFDRVFNRECTFHSAYVKRAATTEIDCGATAWFGFQLRGNVPVAIKETKIHRVTLETESGTAIRAIPLFPLSLI